MDLIGIERVRGGVVTVVAAAYYYYYAGAWSTTRSSLCLLVGAVEMDSWWDLDTNHDVPSTVYQSSDF